MRKSCHWLAPALLSIHCHAAQIVHEPFDYPAAATLSTSSGGSGWSGAWYQDGGSAVVGAVGLAYTDSLGNVLDTTGRSADTSGPSTTRSFRVFSDTMTGSVWISFLYQLPSSNGRFEGVSFYLGSQQVFSISNPSISATAAIHLANNFVSSNGVSTGRGVFGQTHLIVLKLTKGGGQGGSDLVEAFIDPVLSTTPTSPAASVGGNNFNFDRVRVAGQDGSALLVDELRIGDAFGDVTPHVTPADMDSDGDGLTNGQEALLGLDPNVSNAGLIAGIRNHPDWFGLSSAAGIMSPRNGAVVIRGAANEPLNVVFEVQQSETLVDWNELETTSRQFVLPPGKNFLRLTLRDSLNPASP